MLRSLRYAAEYALAKAALEWIANHTYDRCADRASALARAWFVIDRGRRRLAVSNIMRAGISSSRSAADRIACRAMEHLALVAVESLKSRDVLTSGNWRSEVELSVPDAAMEILERPGQPVLLLSGHIGNWEVAARILSFMKPVTGITRPAKNPRVNELVNKHKPAGDFRLTPKHDADPGRLLSVLRQGEILALLIDQYAMSHGVDLPFFGFPTSVHKSPALLHLVTKTPIIFGACLRTGPMRFRFEASEPLMFPPTGNREGDITRILTDLTGRMENLIRRYPDQYLWAHNRWR